MINRQHLKFQRPNIDPISILDDFERALCNVLGPPPIHTAKAAFLVSTKTKRLT
jgi:hypothetical protein